MVLSQEHTIENSQLTFTTAKDSLHSRKVTSFYSSGMPGSYFFTTENIILSFKHTGINPMDPEVVLKQLQNSTPQENKSSQEEEIGAGSL
jgi:hypothetical protein